MSSPTWLLASLLCGQACMATAAVAAQSKLSENEAITVIGKSPPQLREEVTQYVRQLGIVLGDRPAGRWVDPICPQVIGLAQDQAIRVETQVRSIANEIGARLAPAKCTGNLVIAFTTDAAAVVQQIAKRNTIGDLSFEDRKMLETGAAPIRWWYSNEIRGTDNSATQGGAMPPALMNGVSSSLPSGAPNVVAMPTRDGVGFSRSYTASLVETSSIRAIRHATVVVDANRVQGRSLDSLIDFAAMVGLAEIKLGAAHPGSILNLFAAENVDRLTSNDKALLKSLYVLPLTRKADQHRRVLIGSILKDRLDRGTAR